MKKIALCLALVSLLALGGSAIAEIGTIDAVPAATLLLPYFEVDLSNPNGITTLFSINNASASAAVAHVTFWTDWSIPSLDFDVYLTGYDVQTINIRDIFNGILPVTADAGSDSGDKISPKGSLSQDINFPGATGPCGSAATVYSNPALNGTLIQHLRNIHTGGRSSVYGGCGGANYGDNIARGYVTVDSVVTCNIQFPSSNGYFTNTADNRNLLWGDYFWINPSQNFATGTTLVHIEACPTPSVGNGAGQCPFSFAAGDYTFYGRYNSLAGQDQREPLASTFASRYINGAQFSGGTDLIVWRDSKTQPTGANFVSASCSGTPSWFPLNQTNVVAFDEQEQPTALCTTTTTVSPPPPGTPTCFPLETQRVHVAGGNVIGSDFTPPSAFGWLYLNLNHSLASGDPYPGRAQNWVVTTMSASGKYEVGYDAIRLDSLVSSAPGGVILIP